MKVCSIPEVWQEVSAHITALRSLETVCAECNDADGVDIIGEVTHCTRCGKKVWE